MMKQSKGFLILSFNYDFSDLLFKDKEVSGRFDKFGTYEVQFTFEKPLISNGSTESY